MSAVWTVTRAAIRRRRLQTSTVATVVALSTATIVFALGLLDASSRPFDRAFERQHGAHVTATFDPQVVAVDTIAATKRRPGVAAAGGPFVTTALSVRFSDGVQDISVVGRSGSGGPVDDVVLTDGRWPTRLGEIVLAVHLDTSAWPVGSQLEAPGSPALTVVGVGQSVTRTADAWVTPAQAAALGSSHGLQILYRFTDATTSAELGAAVSKATAGLPPDALVNAEPYFVERERNSFTPLMPFLITFGVLGLLISILIVANVISGAVIAGFRHIGVLKAIGFTPIQVVASYLAMIAVPAMMGSIVGTVAGALLSRPLLANAFTVVGIAPTGPSPWILAASPVVISLIAVGVAQVPAVRAGRLPAREVLSAGTAPRAGRGQRVQRLLSSTWLPRPVSLGLGLPFARPGRATLTLAAVVLGTATVTLAVGMRGTVDHYQQATYRTGAAQVDVTSPAGMDAAKVEPMLRAQPGTVHVSSEMRLQAQAPGIADTLDVSAMSGDATTLGYQRVDGRWFESRGEAVVDPAFLSSWGRSIGDSLTLNINGERIPVRIVGTYYLDRNDALLTDRSTMTPVTAVTAVHHFVGLAPGADPQSYAAAVTATNPRLTAGPVEESTSFTRVTTSLIAMLTTVLAAVAALGVLYSVVLITRERSRDLGVLRSLGMTPVQVLTAVVTSMAGLGLVGGLLGVPLGMAAHRIIVPLTADANSTQFPASFVNVFALPTVASLILAGTMIAVLGALIPAGRAARTKIATVLHTE